MEVAWYVVRSKPHKETQLYNYLCMKEIEAFYPTIKVKPVNPRSAKIRPYFPGYLFVHVDIEAVGQNTLNWMPGANGLISFGGDPAIVPENFIYELKCRLDKLRAERDLGVRGMKHGDRVKITSGPFAGYEAIFDMRINGEERVQVLLQWLGRQLPVEVSASRIEKKFTH